MKRALLITTSQSALIAVQVGDLWRTLNVDYSFQISLLLNDELTLQ